MAERMDYYPVTRYIAACQVDMCMWYQEHRSAANAKRDGERHLAEWHAESENQPKREELPEVPKVVDLMAALEASLAAVKRGRT